MTSKKKIFTAFKFFKKHLKNYSKEIIIICIFTIVIVFLNLVTTVFISKFINNSIKENSLDFLKIIPLLILLTVFKIILSYIVGFLANKTGTHLSNDLKLNISDTILYGDYKKISTKQTGDLFQTLNSDIDKISGFASELLFDIFSKAALFVGVSVFIYIINPILLLVVVIYIPIAIFMTIKVNNKMDYFIERSTELEGYSLSVTEQLLSQIPIIKTFFAHSQMKSRILDTYNELYENEKKVSFWYSLIQPLFGSIDSIPRIAYILFAGNMVLSGNITIGLFVSVLDLLIYIIEPSIYFPFILTDFTKTVASMNRIMELENIPKQEDAVISDDNHELVLNIKDVSFSYEDGQDIIQNLSFSYSGSGIVVLSGDSGKGKSTLLKLLSNLYKPDLGSISLGGNIAYASQFTFIFNGSIIENAAISNMSVEYKEIESVFKRVNAHSFVNQLPDKYNTIIGDGATELSGGEKERLAFARVLLSEASVYLLDEPTSALDAFNEKIIIDLIKEESKEKLIIISTHSQKIIDIADKILYL